VLPRAGTPTATTPSRLHTAPLPPPGAGGDILLSVDTTASAAPRRHQGGTRRKPGALPPSTPNRLSHRGWCPHGVSVCVSVSACVSAKLTCRNIGPLACRINNGAVCLRKVPIGQPGGMCVCLCVCVCVAGGGGCARGRRHVTEGLRYGFKRLSKSNTEGHWNIALIASKQVYGSSTCQDLQQPSIP